MDIKVIISLNVLIDPFLVTTPAGDSFVAKSVFRCCPISLSNKVTLGCLVELHMLDFDIIFGIDWLYNFFYSTDRRTRVIKFQFLNKSLLELNGKTQSLEVKIIVCLKSCKMISRGCLYHIARVKDLYSKALPLELVRVVKDFPEVFRNDLPVTPPEWKIDFGIDLLPNTKLI